MNKMITFGSKNLLVVLLAALSGIVGTFSVPIDKFDMPDVYDSVIPKIEFVPEFETTPATTTNVETSLQAKDLTDIKVNAEATSKLDESILDALVELRFLGEVLEADTTYIENRKNEDSSWPDSISARVDSKFATPEDERIFNEDIQHAISAMAALKMMEQKLSFINNSTEQRLQAQPITNIDALFGKINEHAPMIQDLFNLKYFEGVLHSINSMIDGTLTDDELNLSFSKTPEDTLYPFIPEVNYDDDELSLGLVEFVILLFTGIGFFFVLFLIVYLILIGLQKCLNKSSDMSKKSKYEQI